MHALENAREELISGCFRNGFVYFRPSWRALSRWFQTELSQVTTLLYHKAVLSSQRLTEWGELEALEQPGEQGGAGRLGSLGVSGKQW